MRIISGIYKSRSIVAPTGVMTRPTSDRAREALFNMLATMVDFDEMAVLDLFCGSGAFAFEAISRGAATATCIDNTKPAVEAVKKNAEALGCGKRVKAMRSDVYSWVPQANEKYDLIFADPPYDDERLNEELPRILFASRLLTPDSIVIIEHRSGSDLVVPPGARVIKERTASLAQFTFLQISGSTESGSSETGDLSGDVRSDHERTS